MELLILLPLMLLVLAVSIFTVGQITTIFQHGRSRSRQRRDRQVIDTVLHEMRAAQFELQGRERELEAATKRLGVSNDQLARLNTMKSKFLSMAVHDVRTPLAAVDGFAHMLGRSATLGIKERQYVDYITRATKQINSLLGDLTDLAVIEAGKFRLQPEQMELRTLMADVTPGIALLAEKKGVHFSVAETPEGNVVFHGDRQRLARVLTNLLGNAIKFTPAGGSVELRSQISGGKLMLSVKDTGPGIHPSERTRIFEKFYQSQFLKNEKARAAGWGLGLAICEEIVRSHGGQIGVDSPGLGRGATFWVRLPLEARRFAAPARALAAGAMLVAVCALPLRAQQLPLEEKARYEESLERKASGVLLRLLGPNRYKVSVDATVDFTRIERFESRESTAPIAAASSDGYLWSGEPAPTSGDEILPGMPVQSAGPTRGPSGPKRPQFYERSNSYPAEFLKRLAVTVVLDQGVDTAKSDDIRAILTDILGITPARGDELTVVRSAFMPAWKTLWYEPETAGLIMKYALVALLSIMTLIVVSICFMRLSSAMSDIANAQTQQLTMEMRGNSGLPLEEKPGSAEDPALLETGAMSQPVAAGGSAVRFAVREDQLEALASMLAPESPANIALICAHLDQSVRAKVLDRLPGELSTDILVHMGRIRFVEPGMILNLKEEVESRLAGAVGGTAWLAEMIAEADLTERGRMLAVISERDPALAEQLRGQLFVLEDLAALAPDDWSRLLPKLTNEEWATALQGASQSVIDSLKGAAGEGQWKILSQMLESPPADPGLKRAAQNHLLREASAFKCAAAAPAQGLVVAGKIPAQGASDALS